MVSLRLGRQPRLIVQVSLYAIASWAFVVHMICMILIAFRMRSHSVVTDPSMGCAGQGSPFISLLRRATWNRKMSACSLELGELGNAQEHALAVRHPCQI